MKLYICNDKHKQTILRIINRGRELNVSKEEQIGAKLIYLVFNFFQMAERAFRSRTFSDSVVATDAMECALAEDLHGNSNSPSISQLLWFSENKSIKQIYKIKKWK